MYIPKKGYIMTSRNETKTVLIERNAELEATVARLTAEVEALKAKMQTPKAKAGLDQHATFLKAGIMSAIDQKVDGKRDWEALGVAINRFDAYANPGMPVWNIDPFAWEALDPFARFLALTGHCKSGWSSGGSRRIDGVKIPASNGTAYDKRREMLARRLTAFGLEHGETITREGETVRLAA